MGAEMTKDEALKLALDALYCSDDFLFDYHECEPHDERELRRYEHARTQNIKAIDAIIKVLAQPKRTWVGLTDEEIDRLNFTQVGGCQCSFGYIEGIEEFAKSIEAKLREKNS